MKKTAIILLFLSLNTLVSYAQEDAIIDLRLLGHVDEEVDKYYYYKDLNGDLNKFLGTWKYEDATKELIVTFYLNQHDESGGTYYDRIFARYKYTENGTIIYNTLNDLSASKYDIFGGSISDNGRKISMAYYEPTDILHRYSPHQRLIIKYLPCSGLGCMPQLQWDVTWLKGQDSDVWPFKIPAHIVLTKL